MARRNRKKTTKRARAADEVSQHLVEHMRFLGLASIDEYRAWCRRHGFAAKIDKGWHVLRREREEVAQQRVREAAASQRRFSDGVAALEAALTGDLDPGELRNADLRSACSVLAGMGGQRPRRAELTELLRIVNARGRFLLERDTVAGRPVPYVAGLAALNERRGQWIRALDDWRPRSHNARKQFSSLARHLLAEYPVPVFMDAAWLRRDRGSHALRDWFVHIGRGGNPRTAATPVALTKKVAHHFLLAPDRYSIEGAVRWGQVHALGGGPRLTEALVATTLGSSFENEDFWRTVVAFFVANPMLDVAQVGPIVDFILHRKFDPTEVVLPDGSIEERPPTQPGFSMARRTPQSLLAQMQRWHRQLGHGLEGSTALWSSSGIGELRWQTAGANPTLWTIRELRSARALQLEGQQMEHCVATYAASCSSGRCSIWAMALTTKDGVEKRQTVEVSRQRVIVESRGKRNELPRQQELEVLRRWATQEELAIATYL